MLLHSVLRIVIAVLLSLTLSNTIYAADVSNDSIKPVKNWEAGLVQGQQGKYLYYRLPEFIANLNTNGQHASFIKLGATLELQNEKAVTAVDDNLSLIRDGVLSYLRELHPADLENPKLMDICAEMLRRINSLVAPAKAYGVLFEELIIQ